MFDFPALDVAIGLVFLYFVLALICSTANEAIASAFGMRARFLRLGLLNLLSAAPKVTDEGQEALRQLYKHPLVQTLVRPTESLPDDFDPVEPTKWWRRPPYPSYLPSRTFVAALTDLAQDTKGWQEKAKPEDVEAANQRVSAARRKLEKEIAAIPNTKLSEALLAVYRSVEGDAARFQHAAEQWFDDSMERVSGWYKRRVQLILFVIGAVVVLLLNADSLATGRVLWRDDAVRAAVVSQAEAATEQDSGEVDIGETVRELDVPLGWDFSLGDEPNQVPDDVLSVVAKLLGLALTVGALTLGASFWFDLLSKIMRVRSSGAPPPATESIRKGEGEQARAGAGADD